jgi:hypothetical protein
MKLKFKLRMRQRGEWFLSHTARNYRERSSYRMSFGGRVPYPSK